MSQVSICNQALTQLGASLIISIDQDTTEAKLCKLNYQLALDTLLEAASWSFATVVQELPSNAEIPLSPYTNKYLIPVSIVRVLEASNVSDFRRVNTTNWQIEGKYIVSDSAQLFVRAISNQITTSAFTPSFTKAMVAMLAASMALAITQSQPIEQAKLSEAGNLTQIAATLDGTQGRTKKLRSAKYLRVRRSSGGYYQSYQQG